MSKRRITAIHTRALHKQAILDILQKYGWVSVGEFFHKCPNRRAYSRALDSLIKDGAVRVSEPANVIRYLYRPPLEGG